MRLFHARRRVATVVLTSFSMASAPADAATRVTPGSFTGYAFDARCTPAQAEMDAWLTTSPFWAVGVYIGGSERACAEPIPTAAWVKRQSREGWKLLPIWVGPQASCTGYSDLIDPSAANGYAAARAQGRAQAGRAADTAGRLGVRQGSTLWYDIEDFDPGHSDDCRRSALSFLSGWTSRLRRLGYRSGVYSNVAAAIHALDYADSVSPGSYVMPDQIWYAWANGRSDTHIPHKWVRSSSWSPGGRIHQYALDTQATYGGVTLQIDRSFLDLGHGSVAPRPAPSCGVRVDFTRYRRLTRGASNAQVEAVQCLLRQKRQYDGRVHGRFDRQTYRAVRSFQRSRDLRVTGRVTAPTWTVLLSEGASPVLKHGSASNAVHRLQRSLNASVRADLRVTGVYTAETTQAVTAYQRLRGLPRTGVVAADTWASLQR
jgi:hypothetical protein